MSSGNDRITPSTSGERIASGTSNNKLVTQESSAARPPAADNKSNLPSHRRKCVQWCCPERCCTPLGFGLWVGFLLLIQAGPAAILYMDHRNSHRYGSTLSRYQTQQGMQSVLCKTVGIYSVNVTGKCENFLPCLKVKVIVYPTDSVKPIVNSTFLLHSEREHVIPRWNRLVSSWSQMLTSFTCWVSYLEDASYPMALACWAMRRTELIFHGVIQTPRELYDGVKTKTTAKCAHLGNLQFL